MTDDMEDAGQEPHPLEEFTGLFKTPSGQAFADEAAVRINDYVTKRQIADANTAAGQQFSDNLQEMRQNFVGMVQDDPASTDLALELAHLGVSAMVGSVPGADPKHLDTISTSIQQDVARHAVHSMAE